MEATRDINRHDFLDNSNIGNWMTVLMTKVACTKDSAEMSINNRSYLFILPFQMEHLVHPFFFLVHPLKIQTFLPLYSYGFPRETSECSRHLWDTLDLLLWLWSLLLTALFSWKLCQRWTWSNGRRCSRKLEGKRFIWLWLTAGKNPFSHPGFSTVCIMGMALQCTTHRQLAMLCLMNIFILNIHLRDKVGDMGCPGRS